MRIYARGVEIVFLLRIPIAFLCATAPRRWTAISMGAIRRRNAIGSLSTAGVPILQNLGRPGMMPTRFLHPRELAYPYIQPAIHHRICRLGYYHYNVVHLVVM